MKKRMIALVLSVLMTTSMTAILGLASILRLTRTARSPLMSAGIQRRAPRLRSSRLTKIPI